MDSLVRSPASLLSPRSAVLLSSLQTTDRRSRHAVLCRGAFDYSGPAGAHLALVDQRRARVCTRFCLPLSCSPPAAVVWPAAGCSVSCGIILVASTGTSQQCMASVLFISYSSACYSTIITKQIRSTGNVLCPALTITTPPLTYVRMGSARPPVPRARPCLLEQQPVVETQNQSARRAR